MARLTREVSMMLDHYAQNPNWECEESFIRQTVPIRSRRKLVKRGVLYKITDSNKAFKWAYIAGPVERTELINLRVYLEGRSAIPKEWARMGGLA